MSEPTPTPGAVGDAPPTSGGAPLHASPGARIRAAREAAGMHIVALAAALKVPVRKLEALEAERWSELGDATFTRALAASVARHLKMDAQALLAAMPNGQSHTLHIPSGLAPAPATSPRPLSPMVWSAVAVLALAAVVVWLPREWFQEPPSASAPNAPPAADAAGTALGESSKVASAESAPTAPSPGPASAEPAPPQPAASSPAPTAPPPAASSAAAAPAAAAVTPAAPAPAVAPKIEAPAAAQTSAGASSGTETVAPKPGAVLLQLELSAPSWVEVSDGTGKLRIQRIANAGDRLVFDDASRYAVVLGNASAVQVRINGQPRALADVTRNNVARFQVP